MQAAVQYTVEAQARISQFNDFEVESATGTAVSVTELPLVSVSDSIITGESTARADATATPFSLEASVANQNTGINVTQGISRFVDSEFRVKSSQALLDLIGPGESGLDVLVNYVVSVDAFTGLNGGWADQANSTVIVDLAVNSAAGIQASDGVHQIARSVALGDTVEMSGLFSGFSEAGGSTVVSLPARLSPFQADGLTIRTVASLEVQGLSVAGGVVNTSATVSLLDFENVLTLLDGTSLVSQGVDVWPVPTVQSIPEPSTFIVWSLLGSLAIAVGWLRRSKHT